MTKAIANQENLTSYTCVNVSQVAAVHKVYYTERQPPQPESLISTEDAGSASGQSLPKICWTHQCSSPRKSLVKGERLIRDEEKPESLMFACSPSALAFPSMCDFRHGLSPHTSRHVGIYHFKDEFWILRNMRSSSMVTRIQPYHSEHSWSRPISEAEQGRAWLVLGMGDRLWIPDAVSFFSSPCRSNFPSQEGDSERELGGWEREREGARKQREGTRRGREGERERERERERGR